MYFINIENTSTTKTNTTSMNRSKVADKHNVPRIEYVSRRLPALVQKIQPVDDIEKYPSATNANAALFDSLPLVPLRQSTTDQQTVRSTDDSSYKPNIARSLTPNIPKSPSLSTDNLSNLKQIKDSNHGFRHWFSNLTSKQKIVFKGLIAALTLLTTAAAIVLPVYIFVIRQNRLESSFTNITASVCSTSTCIGKETPYRTSIVTALYAFDGNVNDQTGYATGTAYGLTAPSLTAAGYVSQAINLAAISSQYVQIPNINFAKQSFTLQAWLNPASPTTPGDYAIFGQCDSNFICLSLSLRNARIALSFDSMNTSSNTLIGSTIITANWVHVTAVYDAILFQQKIYVNGQIDAVSYGTVNPYQGVSSSSTITTIGRSLSFANTTSYFNGRIDHFTISVGVARSACKILNDASLVVYFPFDTTGTLNDYNVNVCNGIASGTTTISTGRIGQAISFTSNSSYFQAPCFPKMRSNEYSYSFSLWVNPNSIVGGGSLVHISSVANGTANCYDVLAFTGTGNLVFQWMIPATTVIGVQGPVIPANTWTHVAVVYLFTNGVRLYINGQFSASSSNTGSFTVYDSWAAIYPLYITLGNTGTTGSLGPLSCSTGTISILPGPFAGAIDDFRLYNRELDSEEICVLANP